MMTQENTETYNGWKNYPTWAVNLWLSNDEGLYAGTLARVEASKGEGRHEVADTLKAWVTLDLTPDLGAMILAAYWRDRREQERYERRQSLIRWYTDDSHKSERVK